MTAGEEKHDHQRPASRAGQALILMSGLVSAAIVTLALSQLQGIIRPFLIAVFLCFLVKPLTRKLGRRTGILGYVLAIAIFFGIFSVAQRVVAADTSTFSENKAGYGKKIEKFKATLKEYSAEHSLLDKILYPNVDPKQTQSSDTPKPGEKNGDHSDPETKTRAPTTDGAAREESADPWILDILDPEEISQLLGSSASLFFGVFGEMIIVLITMMLLLLESDRLPGRLKRVYGAEKADKILLVFHRASQSVTRYVSLKVWVSLLTSVICVIVMSLFDLHYAITFGIIVFVFNFVPYIGSVIATVFPCIVMMLQDDGSPLLALWLGLALTVTQQIVGNFVEPRIQGKGLSISPVVIVLSLGFWGWLWGIGGMVLAVPITVTIRIVLEQFETTRQFALMVGGDE